MSQLRSHSVAETIASTAVGFVLSYLLGLVLYPALGLEVSHSNNFLIVSAFTLLSLLRGYTIRRAFNWLHVRLNALD